MLPLCAYVVHDELVDQETQNSFVGHARDEILTMTIARPKQPSCVHGVGGAIGFRDYFG